ncbi:MAG TPA: FoF1 ATP synthase subunit gamma [Candidatus Woesebacteria bacterium]|nr:FoF1 ATP synthase subunit gamma [Candidatus Woesebacteria bacterium]
MQKQTDLVEEIQFLDNLHNLATIYESISTMKMQQIRKSIINRRLYVNNLMDIFRSLQYEKTPAEYEVVQQKDLKPLATVIITANAKFHGDIIRRIFDYFIQHYNQKGDLFVIGKIGREYIKQYSDKIQFQEYDVSDINFTVNDLKPILAHVLQYRRIHVYYALFKNIVDQIPVETDITDLEKLTKEEIEETQKMQHYSYLYEPSAQEISAFIHNNVTAMSLLQTLSETHLARLASRMNAMESLLGKINNDIKVLKQREHRVKRSIQDSKQLDRLSGIMLW